MRDEMRVRRRIIERIRRVTALVIAATFLSQNFAWAVCADGTTLPAGGFVIGQAPAVNANNWSPGVFTGTTGSIWVPDTSVYEHNDPTQPLTGGGHNWVFDQGSSLCKETDTGPAGSLPTGWKIEPNFPTFCVLLPVIDLRGIVTNVGDIPFQGDAITPTCDPTQYVGGDPTNGAGLPTNTYFNHLGCSISHGIATTPQTATTFLFVAGIKSGMFSIPLDNVDNQVVGGEAGKTITDQNYYSQIPSGSLLTSAAVSKDGQFAIATSRQQDLRVWGCLNPLGDPGDPGQPINPFFFVPPGSEVNCMPVGSNNLAADLTTAFGPDNQPYFGGRIVINSFNSVPGSSDFNPVAGAWPNCIWQTNGAGSLANAFALSDQSIFQNGCGSAQPNFAFTSALITQPNALISHGKYMYSGPIGGTVYQFLVKVDPISGLSNYRFRTYVTGLSIVTGLGVDDALQSLFVFSDPTAIGLAAREFVTKLPLCEDMDGEDPPAGGTVAGGTAGGTLAGGTTGGTVPGNTAGGTATGGAPPTLAAVGNLFTSAGAATTAATGSGAATTGGFIFPGGNPAPGATAQNAGTSATGTAATTGAGTTTTGVFTPLRAGTTITGASAAGAGTVTGAGITTTGAITPPAGVAGAGNTPTGLGIIAIGGSTSAIPASGVITGPTFTVKVVPPGVGG